MYNFNLYDIFKEKINIRNNIDNLMKSLSNKYEVIKLSNNELLIKSNNNIINNNDLFDIYNNFDNYIANDTTIPNKLLYNILTINNNTFIIKL